MAVDTKDKENKENENEVEDDGFHPDVNALMADVNEDELLADIIREEPKERDPEECTVVIDGLPAVENSEKLEKLKAVIAKLYKKFDENAFGSFPTEEGGKAKGFCFVDFETVEDARAAVFGLDNYRLDKKHTLTARLLSDLMKVSEPDKEWKPPQPKPFKDPGNLWWWLEDEKCIDQFAVLSVDGGLLEVFKNDPFEITHVCQEASRKNWTRLHFQWSPRGGYLATVHDKGIALWGGAKFEQIGRFAHERVFKLDFSPCERYLVTMSPVNTKYSTHIVDEDALCVFDIRSTDLLRKFPVGGQTGLKIGEWPMLKWSPNSTYMACRKDRDGQGEAISIYTMPDCHLLNKKSISMPRVVDMEWSPTDDLLAYWVAENPDGSAPARLAVMSVPNCFDKGTRNAFQVASARIFWQKSGERLAMEVTRYGKVKRSQKNEPPTYTQLSYALEIFNVKVKDVPVDSVQLKPRGDAKEAEDCRPLSFGWEPHGDKFCILMGTDRNAVPVFYQCSSGKVTEIKCLDDKLGAINTVEWAPQGSWCVIAGLKRGSTGSGSLIFVDASGSEVTKVATVEHQGCNALHFDPTGRFVVSAISKWVNYGGGVVPSGQNFGINMYSSQGRLLRRLEYDQMAMFAWRPRPPCCLSEKQLKDIKKNMKAYAEKFAMQDKIDASRASQEVMARRRQRKEEWERFKAEQAKLDEQELPEKKKLRADGVDAAHREMVTEVIDIPLDTTKVEHSREELEE